MGFAEELAKLSERVRQKRNLVVGEENAKAAFISPFLNILGYDITDPTEVIHEYFADFGIQNKVRHPKKVDYAIAINNNIVMLVEAKACTEKPEIHDGQLRYYFNAIYTARIGMATNGIEYRFFTDLHRDNMMDDEPFFTFDILNYEVKDVENLKLFHRDNFDALNMNHHAEAIIFYRNMTLLIGNLLQSPSDDFIRFLVGEMFKAAPDCKMYNKINKNLIEKCKPIVKKSIQSSVLDLVTRSMNQQMSPLEIESEPPTINSDDETQDTEKKSEINTTQEELEAFSKIQLIVKASNKFKFELHFKDTISYLGINLGKTTWWFLRLYLSSAKKSLIARISADEAKVLAPGFTIQEVPGVNEETLCKISIISIEDLDKLKSLILKSYELESAKH